jgi:hypothetical protein
MIGLKAKGIFFDVGAVQKPKDRAVIRWLFKSAAYVRTTASRSFPKKGKGSSPPGRPPTPHLGLIKKFMRFAVEVQKATAVIGPEKLGDKIGDALEAQERGGRSLFLIRSTRTRRTKLLGRYPPRPTMGPALVKSAPALGGFMKDQIRP